jgi:hypothetical protein
LEELLIKSLSSAGEYAPLLVVAVGLVVLTVRYCAGFIEKRIAEANTRTEEANVRAKEVYEDSKKREDQIIEMMDRNSEVNANMLSALQRQNDLMNGVILEQARVREEQHRMSNDIIEIKTLLKH